MLSCSLRRYYCSVVASSFVVRRCRRSSFAFAVVRCRRRSLSSSFATVAVVVIHRTTEVDVVVVVVVVVAGMTLPAIRIVAQTVMTRSCAHARPSLRVRMCVSERLFLRSVRLAFMRWSVFAVRLLSGLEQCINTRQGQGLEE